MINSIKLVFLTTFQGCFEARAEIQKYFCCFLVQMKSLEFAFEINWPLVTHLNKNPFSDDQISFNLSCSYDSFEHCAASLQSNLCSNYLLVSLNQ